MSEQTPRDDLVERLRGPHEWGYRCLAGGGFVDDCAPLEAADRIERLEADLRTVQNAAKTLHAARDTELQHIRENAAFDHKLRQEHQSLIDRDALMTDALLAAQAEIDRLQKACARQNEEVCQVLGKALGYPWFTDDPANFPDATEEHGVCVSDHVAESLADEAAARIKSLEARAQAAEAEVARLTAEREKDRKALEVALSSMAREKCTGSHRIAINTISARLEEHNG